MYVSLYLYICLCLYLFMYIKENISMYVNVTARLLPLPRVACLTILKVTFEVCFAEVNSRTNV